MITVELDKGLIEDGTEHKKVVLKQPTAADILEATTESERAVATPQGYKLIVSPSLLGANLLRRQIKEIGAIEGPLTMTMLKKLSAKDLDILNEAVDRMDEAAADKIAEEMKNRGES